jgi:hypothetical protein
MANSRLIINNIPDIRVQEAPRKWIVTFRGDGTLECVYEFVGEPWVEGLDITGYEELARVLKFIDEYIIIDGKIRRRTEEELRKRTREIFDRVKSGELRRRKDEDDVISKYSHHFTAEELTSVEPLEDRVARLEDKIKTLER